MASSLISNSHHIDFDSVFGMEDASLASVFESLISTGLKEFLGCPAIYYDAALTEFFANGSVRDGVVVSTIGGTAVQISESVFASTFELPSEGLTDLSDVPKNLVFDARSLFSDSKEQVSISCLKKELKIEYRLLQDILAKTIYVKAGSFDAVTRDRFMLMTAITHFFTQFPTTMASSLISSSHHIDFDSVFGMEDASLAPVFESLITTGLKEFLGCPAIFYEAALTEFFANGSVRDGVVVSTIGGTVVEISESVFAATFELPSEGLTDLSDVPRNIVFDARGLFSDSKEQVSISCFKKELKIEYRLLHDILAKMIYVKAGYFDVVTRDRFMLMTAITFDVKINWSNLLFGVLKAMVTPGSRQAKGFANQIGVVLSNIPGLDLGEPHAFPPPRVLNEKMVHRFVHINEQVVMEKTAGSPPMKKTPKKRAVSKKRPVDSDAEVAPIVKKKRTTKGKPATTRLEAVPLQTIEPTADVPDEQLSKPKRKSQKRKRRLVLDDVDETGESAAEQPAAGNATGVQETSADVPVATQPAVAPADEDQPADDPDAIIEQILTQLDTAATKGDDQPTAQDKESIPWFDLPFELARQDAEGFLSSDTDEEFIADQPTVLIFPDGGDQPQVFRNSKLVTEEHMSIDDLLMQISEDMMLPSVTAAEITKISLGESISIPVAQERDLFYASLPRISIHD
ncbi:hypothetical protein F511_33843 [Dorcoceras hygrometricum]|uniref:Dystroglycan-like n=1 Tax=Dorcoceras hygrometricum TaxID=472368 RepID=A0A2Z7D8W3_9LAMI|nr:hypothetical protein F511_33843 [Dorcoceras hygrometricum]